MTPEERAKIAYAAAVLKRDAGIGEGHDIILAAIRGGMLQAHAEGYAKAIEDAVRVAENCEVVLTPDDMFGNAQIAAAIRQLKAE